MIQKVTGTHIILATSTFVFPALVPLITAQPVVLNDVFAEYVTYLRHSNTLVEKVYELEKTGAFKGAGTPDGKIMVDQQLAAGATELRDIIYTAWIKSADPVPEYRPSKAGS